MWVVADNVSLELGRKRCADVCACVRACSYAPICLSASVNGRCVFLYAGVGPFAKRNGA